MTADMVAKARANAAQRQATNVEFRLGEIEQLPVADNSVDVILSNCVINPRPLASIRGEELSVRRARAVQDYLVQHSRDPLAMAARLVRRAERGTARAAEQRVDAGDFLRSRPGGAC